MLAEQDNESKVLLENIQINQWSKDSHKICLYDKRGICESEIIRSDILNLERYQLGGIAITGKCKKTLLVNEGDDESGGLLLDFLMSLTEINKLDKTLGRAEATCVEKIIHEMNPCARLLRSYLKIIA